MPSLKSISLRVPVLRRMLGGEHLGFGDMQATLGQSGFVSDGHSVQRVSDALIGTGLLEADERSEMDIASRREGERPSLSESLSAAQKLLTLAEEMRTWAEPQTGGLDGNGWQTLFAPRLSALRQRLRNEHGEDDAWLDQNPESPRSRKAKSRTL